MKFVKIENISPDKTDEVVITAQLTLSSSVDFEWQLKSLRESGAHDLLDEFGKSDDHSWTERPVRLVSGRAFLVRLTAQSAGEPASLVNLRMQADDDSQEALNETEVREVAEWTARRFDWEIDMQEVRTALSVDQYGQELLARFWPARPANMAGPWEGLLKTVVSVQIYPGLATRLQQALLDNYGASQAKFNGRSYTFFPTIERMAEADPEELLEMRFSRQKARYLPGLAQMILNQPERFNWEYLRNLPGPEAVAVLDELPGVGPWTSNYVAMRGLPHPDVFIDEAGLRKALAASYDRRADISSEELAKLTAIYAPHRSIACYYTYMKMYQV